MPSLIQQLRERVMERDEKKNRLVRIKRGAVSRIAESLGVSHGTVTGWLLLRHEPCRLIRPRIRKLLGDADFDFLPMKPGPNGSRHEEFHKAFSE